MWILISKYSLFTAVSYSNQDGFYSTAPCHSGTDSINWMSLLIKIASLVLWDLHFIKPWQHSNIAISRLASRVSWCATEDCYTVEPLCSDSIRVHLLMKCIHFTGWAVIGCRLLPSSTSPVLYLVMTRQLYIFQQCFVLPELSSLSTM